MALETSWLEEHLKGGEVHHLYAALEEGTEMRKQERKVSLIIIYGVRGRKEMRREMHFQLALALVTSFLVGFTLKSCQIDVQSAT